MGLMLGEFVDEYTVNVIDVFAMPQSGTVCIDSIANYIFLLPHTVIDLAGCFCRSCGPSLSSENA